MPVSTEIGNITFIAVISVASPTEKPRRQAFHLRVVHAEALEHRPGTVEQVDAQRDVGDDVDDRHRRAAEGGHEVPVDVAPHEVGVGRAPREVGQVEDDEEADDHAGPAHRAAGEVGGLPVPRLHVATAAGAPVHAGQRVRGVDVEGERQGEADAHDPEEHGAREDGTRISRSHSP